MCKPTTAATTVTKPVSFLTRHTDALRLLVVASGICCSYWFYGFLQEKLITKSRLGATFMLVIQSVANILVASVWQNIQSASPATKATTQQKQEQALNHPLLFLTSSCYVGAMIGSNESLRFVPYPVAVLAKSCKLIPTMVMGSLIERRKYSAEQWMAAICISAGIALFNHSRMPGSSFSSSPSSKADEENHYWKGMILLCVSLGMDGFLCAFQGMLKRPGSKKNQQRPPTAVETMMYINVYAFCLLLPLAIASGQWGEGVRLLKQNEQLRLNIAVLNCVVSIGQIFIFLSISWYSSLVTTTITTTRKFFTILFSVLHFGHSFTAGQWASVLMVFGGLYLSIASGNKTAVAKPIPENKKTD
mmetsp:Transcript_6814/g.13873  ORF Transcript_6814/g.13873 Transcript_6814/m.13873 type:complete len:361 (-) Transcript_6814:318-1400(-)|eukprot:CAMPEP_0201126676 /NCGR_PEP_ID=MMETSP0850-20130426/27018_1 /ASSEMBLY_ACC=CAM_ASM_000622 /TAXON_ID=183588 /ORGANISM="Pseudo-nitzschia fraudulenta, Strain WWA7" /LENGTH=360 /DNA_ID=CAMNT_0047395199 /DNA_START=191 /DNA_END=1273 /DNA_ORIENTATION=-